MATHEDVATVDVDKLNANLARVEELSQRLINAFSHHNPANPALHAPSPDLFAKAATSYWTEMLENPGKLFENQLEFWGKSVRHYVDAQQLLLQSGTGEGADAENPAPADKRFANPLWQSNPYFKYVKEQYLLNARAIEQAVAEVDDLDAKEQRRLAYFSRQIIDMMSPTNFLGTNPDALQRAVETEGESLVKGLENLVADLEANNGEVVVRLADENAFELGENIATTSGEVVYRNRMMELIQYAPTTKTVHEVPLVIFPPWINKFYILDLKEQNSLIKWITDPGVYVVRCVLGQPGCVPLPMLECRIISKMAFLAAIREAKAITRQKAGERGRILHCRDHPASDTGPARQTQGQER